jgi:hypothetical protein
MKKSAKAKRDIAMAFDFVRYLIDHPEELAKIPNGSEVCFHDVSNEAEATSSKKYSETGKSVQVNVKRDFEIKKKVA